MFYKSSHSSTAIDIYFFHKYVNFEVIIGEKL